MQVDLTTIVILAIFAAGTWFMWTAWRRGVLRSKVAGNAPAPAGKPDLTDVRPGGVLALNRVGPNMADFDVEIVGRHVYRQGGWEWLELEGEGPEGKVWLDVEDDDELEVGISLRRMTLEEVGLTEAGLQTMATDKRGELSFEGREYELEESGEAQFLRDGDPDRAQGFRFWDFETADGEHYLSVEDWGGGDWQAHYSQPLSPSQVEIYSAGGDHG